MTEKRLFVGRKTVEDRFTIINDYDDEIGVKENRSGDVLVLKHSDLNAQQFVAQLVVFLNDQNQAIVDLYDGSKFWSDKATERIKELEEENEQLKEINQELYDFRLVLNALLFNEWAETGKYEVYKSKRHHDGEPCFDGEWFIVVAILPSGQVTNHYHIKYWDYFKIPSYEKVKDEFDGHTSSVVLLRYGVLLE